MAFNILIVDDSRVMRSVIERSIEMSGVPVGRILMAENGQVGLEALRDNWVDIVFLDVNMPVLDGIAMTDSMRRDPFLKNTPVVVVSSEASDAKKATLFQNGAREFIEKPFTPEKIREVIHNVLGIWEDNQGPETDSF